MQQSYRILIIDDDYSTCAFLEMLLSDEGYLVATAHSGEDGFARLPTFSPHLILLDLMMPIMDGVMFLQRLADLHPPVIVMSVSPKLIEQAVGLGAVSALSKPFDVSDLVTAVEFHLLRGGESAARFK